MNTEIEKQGLGVAKSILSMSPAERRALLEDAHACGLVQIFEETTDFLQNARVSVPEHA